MLLELRIWLLHLVQEGYGSEKYSLSIQWWRMKDWYPVFPITIKKILKVQSDWIDLPNRFNLASKLHFHAYWHLVDCS